MGQDLAHVHSITEAAGLPNKARLTMALLILDKLPTLPLDLSYCIAITRMLAYCLESCAFQAWRVTGDGDYLLDNNTQTSSLISLKLKHMADGTGLDEPGPSGATSPAGSASSAMPCSPVHSPFHSHSRTRTKGGGGRSWSSSASNLFSQGTQPESSTTSDPDEGSGGSSASEDDSKSDGEGETDSNDGAPGSGGGSDDESSGSSESGSEEATDNEHAQQDGLDNESKGSGKEMEGSDAGGDSSPSESDHAESPPKAFPPVKKAPEVNLNTSQMLSLLD